MPAEGFREYAGYTRSNKGGHYPGSRKSGEDFGFEVAGVGLGNHGVDDHHHRAYAQPLDGSSHHKPPHGGNHYGHDEAEAEDERTEQHRGTHASGVGD